jgi:glyoxylase-like metal-dependent hydrolase (beta-lactamase superfamily II)
LFTGDTLYRSHQEWKTLVFSSDGGSADSLIKSLETLRSLKPDAVICSAYVGETAVMEMYVTKWHKIIDSNISQLTRRV